MPFLLKAFIFQCLRICNIVSFILLTSLVEGAEPKKVPGGLFLHFLICLFQVLIYSGRCSELCMFVGAFRAFRNMNGNLSILLNKQEKAENEMIDVQDTFLHGVVNPDYNERKEKDFRKSFNDPKHPRW